MSQSHKEVIVHNMEGNCFGTLGISQSYRPLLDFCGFSNHLISWVIYKAF